MFVAAKGVLQPLVEVVDDFLLHVLDFALDERAVFVEKLLSRENAVASGTANWRVSMFSGSCSNWWQPQVGQWRVTEREWSFMVKTPLPRGPRQRVTLKRAFQEYHSTGRRRFVVHD